MFNLFMFIQTQVQMSRAAVCSSFVLEEVAAEALEDAKKAEQVVEDAMTFM